MDAFSASYQRWLEAQERVSDFEKQVFDPDHQLTDEELSRLRALRGIAGACLRQLINELDEEVGRLHRHADGGIAEGPTAS